MILNTMNLVVGLFLFNVFVFALYLTMLQNLSDQRTGVHGIYVLRAQYKKLPDTDRPTAGNISDGFRTVLTGSDCKGIQYPYYLRQEDGWYPVDDINSTYVFSAYIDAREEDNIAVIGARLTHLPNEGLVCQMWMLDSDRTSVTMVEAMATSRLLPEGHRRRYTASVITCPVARQLTPDRVSIVSKMCASPLNLLKIHWIKPPATYSRRFTICLTPLNFRYGKAYELVEWIEMNRILGADFFTLYNYSTARNVRNVLDYYRHQGIVEVVNWNLPMRVDTWPRRNKSSIEIHYFGQLAALNECWRRNLPHSEYLVYADLDEFIVPREREAHTWYDVIEKFTSASAFLFKNVFFRKEWNDKNAMSVDHGSACLYRLVTLLKTVRETRIFTHMMRSKYIIRSDSVLALGVHKVGKLRNWSLRRVSQDVGLLHHYRDLGNATDNTERITDDTMVTKYGDHLVERVKEVWSELSNIDMDMTYV